MNGVWGLTIVAAAAAIALTGCAGRSGGSSSGAAVRVPAVEAVPARFGSLPRAQLEEVQARAVRIRALAAGGLASQLDLETREAQLAAAQARATAEERRAALANASVVAPVAGLVGRRDVEVGMVVDSGSALFVLGDPDRLIVELPLTQEMLAAVDEVLRAASTDQPTPANR